MSFNRIQNLNAHYYLATFLCQPQFQSIIQPLLGEHFKHKDNKKGQMQDKNQEENKIKKAANKDRSFLEGI